MVVRSDALLLPKHLTNEATLLPATTFTVNSNLRPVSFSYRREVEMGYIGPGGSGGVGA